MRKYAHPLPEDTNGEYRLSPASSPFQRTKVADLSLRAYISNEDKARVAGEE